MAILELLNHGAIAILGGYLALSGFLASGVEQLLVLVGIPIPTVVTMEPTSEHVTESANQKGVTELPSRYQIGGSIPKILLESLEYQQAAVAGAGTSESQERKTAERAEDALVNIFCTYRGDDAVHVTTGSGVFIDPRGIILTNAHVAQFLLLGDSTARARCVIRQGDPAEAKYVADLLYISPMWVNENADLIDAEAPSGTGERDYALLYVVEALQGERPENFPALAFDTAPLTKSEEDVPVLVAGYPAAILGTEGPRADLVPKVAKASVTELFTFGGGEADLISVSSSVVGEQGSSGGPIINTAGDVIGLIVTRGDRSTEGARSLRALTIPYINATIQEETGFSLTNTLEGNIKRRSEIFKQALGLFLAGLLEAELAPET